MQISHKYKFIFFSFPKTGSESVRKLLEPYSDIHGIPFWERTEDKPFYSHISPQEVKALFIKNGWNYDEYYKFTFIRNPWGRLVSLYNMIYHTKSPSSLLGRVRALIKNRSTPDFKQWLRTIKNNGVGAGGPENQRWMRYGTYSIASYILDDNDKELVDEVIKLEDINEKLPAILRRIGIPDAEKLSIPYINKRKQKKLSTYYDDESKALIEKNYCYDIQRFNYNFDDID